MSLHSDAVECQLARADVARCLGCLLEDVWDNVVSFLQELKVRELDVSYCNLPTSVITSLLTRATTLEVCSCQLPTLSHILPDAVHGSGVPELPLQVLNAVGCLHQRSCYDATVICLIQVLAISGCAGATSKIWDALHGTGGPELPLQTLSAVGCKRLRSCWLGLQPASQADRAAQQALLSVGMYSPPVPVSTAWQEVPVALTSEPLPSCPSQRMPLLLCCRKDTTVTGLLYAWLSASEILGWRISAMEGICYS